MTGHGLEGGLGFLTHKGSLDREPEERPRLTQPQGATWARSGSRPRGWPFQEHRRFFHILFSDAEMEEEGSWWMANMRLDATFGREKA